MKRLLLIPCLLAFGCVEETRTVSQYQEVDPFAELEAADPLDLSSIDVGVGLRHGEAMAMAYIGSATMEDVTTSAGHAVAVTRSFDQASQEFGEFHIFPPPAEVTARGITDFIRENTSNAFLGARATDIWAEIDDAESESGSSFASRSLVTNFWRYKNDWYVRWDGNLESAENTTGKGPYGFNREDMVTDLLAEIEEAASVSPRYYIVGEDMQQLIATSDGEGLAPAEFSNFLAFYKDAVAAIKSSSSSTEVGCGIHYDAFLEDIVPLFHREGDTTDMLLDRAFRAVILPCAEIGDIVALQSYRVAADTDITLPTGDITVTDGYQFLRRIADLYGLTKPIVWYSVGAPVTSGVNDIRQQNFLESFTEWTAGTNSTFVAWRFAMDLDGSNTANQQVAGQCRAFTESARDLQAPVSDCYDGLVDSAFSNKAPFEALQEATE